MTDDEAAANGQDNAGAEQRRQEQSPAPVAPPNPEKLEEDGTARGERMDAVSEEHEPRAEAAERTDSSLKARAADSAEPLIHPSTPENSRTHEKSAVEKSSELAEEDVSNSEVFTSAPSSPKATRSKRSSTLKSRHISHGSTSTIPGPSEWSHQQLTVQGNELEEQDEEDEEDEWQAMPAFAPFDIYDDDGKLIARSHAEEGGDGEPLAPVGGPAKGYTRVQVDEDAQSATSMDEDTAYLFKGAAIEEDEPVDTMTQMQNTKNLLTENQRIAYVGLVRLALAEMTIQLQKMERTRKAKKTIDIAIEAMILWGQKMMVRAYGHIDLSTAEQLMIEQLSEHGLEPSDLTPSLMVNARIKNPVTADEKDEKEEMKEDEVNEGETNDEVNGDASQDEIQKNEGNGADGEKEEASSSILFDADDARTFSNDSLPPPPYSEEESTLPPIGSPEDLEKKSTLDIDIRWTVLCDLFLILISDGVYDARSRALLERVGEFLQVPWIDVCRFEKRVTDALEMQEAIEKDEWDEKDHMETRRKKARNRRLMYMGLATVGGGLVIGLSAGLLAPLIGAGLAAGFTTIGVTGTSGFLAGAGGAAIIGTGGVLTGGTVGVRAANRRTGAVKTFEYRPLHNSKRVNLIITVSGWMTGKVDDVRLPFSTVDPIMGDIYSILWEPDMLRSTGDTINILASEALTQALQQILGSTILMGLMAALQLPIVLTKLAYFIDNPWSVSLARAELAGLILADSLIDRNLGARPITLVGFSLGSRVIFSCLKELANKGAYGIIQNVFMFGSPIVVNKDDYLKARSIVSGRFVNGYASKDWILGYLFRATGGGISRVAGLAKIEVPEIENFDCTEFVAGHMAYRQAMPKLLRKMGWIVESDEFSEIEDPDPENHDKRQRELINEIEEARKEMDETQKKRFWLFRSNKKLAKKKEWETYDDRLKGGITEEEDTAIRNITAAGDPMFDLEALQREIAELAAHGVEIRELESNQPTIKIDSNSLHAARPSVSLRSKSFDQTVASYERPGTGSRSLDYAPHPRDDEEGMEMSMSFEPEYEPHSHNGYASSTTSIDKTRMAGRAIDASPLRKSLEPDTISSKTSSEHAQEDDIVMTFEPLHTHNTSGLTLPYRSAAQSRQQWDAGQEAAVFHTNSWKSTSDEAPPAPVRHAAPPSPSPSPVSALPRGMSAETPEITIGRNVWADEDEDLGEHGMSMTFE